MYGGISKIIGTSHCGSKNIISTLFPLPVPELSFSTDGVRVSEGSVMAQVCLSLSVPLSAVLTVPLTLSNTGTATQGETLSIKL